LSIWETAISFGQVITRIMQARLGKVTLPFRANLEEVINALNARALKLDRKEASLLAHVKTNRIGLYTTEQEADDLAMEFAALIGITPDQVMQGWLHFMNQAVDVVPAEFRAQEAQSVASCKAMLDADFIATDAAGKKTAMFVPIGNLSEPHHSSCYRLFNFWRNKKTKTYKVGTPAVFNADWAELQAEAIAITADAARQGL
jgi:hypothetical protein